MGQRLLWSVHQNTWQIADAHNDALQEVNQRLQEIAITPANLPDLLEQSGVLDSVKYTIEDDD